MTIFPNENGWSYDDSIGNWKLVYDGNQIVIFKQTDQCIATQSTLFVGTEQECADEIERLCLPWVAEINNTLESPTEP